MSIVDSRLRRFLVRKFLSGARPGGGERVRLVDGEKAFNPTLVPIRVALAATFGVIIAVTSGALILALESGRQNTIGLVRNRSERIIDTIVERTRLHLDPARDQSQFLAKLVLDGDLDPQNEAATLSQLRAALAGIPQIAALAIIRTDLKQLRVERHGNDVVMRKIDMRTVPGLDEAFGLAERQLAQSGENYCGVNA